MLDRFRRRFDPRFKRAWRNRPMRTERQDDTFAGDSERNGARWVLGKWETIQFVDRTPLNTKLKPFTLSKCVHARDPKAGKDRKRLWHTDLAAQSYLDCHFGYASVACHPLVAR